jgi:hypothetical protein
MNALRLWLLRSNEWVRNLSPKGRTTLVVFLTVLFMVAIYFGLLPSKHAHPNPHALYNW